MRELMSIGEFSAISGLSPKRLRTYAVAGLLRPAAVDPDSGYRYYSPDQLRDAELIDALRCAGLPLVDIRTVMQDGRASSLEPWARHVRTDATVRQQALTRAAQLLAEDDPATTKDGGTTVAVHVEVAARSETGPVRADNEDAVVADEHLLAVADGMGGHSAGEVASTVATTAMSAIFTGRSADELEAAVRAANWAVWDRAGSAPALQGMGTTMCAVGLVGEAAAAVANVGDSRAYLLRDGKLQQLTADHTVTADLVRQGALTTAAAVDHPHRRLLTRALGVGAEIEVDVQCISLVDGDRLLLCSDGVSGVVDDDTLGGLLASAATPQDAVDAVVDRALDEHSDDNASAVAAFVTLGAS